MKTKIILLILIPPAIIIGYFIGHSKQATFISVPKPTPIPRPLDKYSIETLSQKIIIPTEIIIEKTLDKTDDYVSHLFSIKYKPELTGLTEKKVTGQLNIPTSDGPFPVIVMLRGYIDQLKYKTGDGTRNGAKYFASRGFITIAPDFLGYADSDSESTNVFETRFQTYTTALTLIESLGSLKNWDNKNTFIWAHSNGGQIALTTLIINEREIPTVLWAPVTKPFPYSILYYTDESDDQGKYLRRELSKFENLYDAQKYSFLDYLDKLKAPLQIHQGTADDAVPIDWSNSFVGKLNAIDHEIDYHVYPGADHNLVPNWSDAIDKSLNFYQNYIE